MNSQDVYSKAMSKQSICNDCMRNTDYLIVERTALSKVIAGLMLTGFFIFVGGYFLGKRTACKDFCQDVEVSHFADQINHALTTLYDQDMRNATAQAAVQGASSMQAFELVEEKSPVLGEANNLPSSSSMSSESKMYQAHLLGGTQKHVADFVSRLAKRGITVELRKRSGTSTNGKKMYWYQAVTPPYTQESELLAVVDIIKKLEKIKDIKIIQTVQA